MTIETNQLTSASTQELAPLPVRETAMLVLQQGADSSRSWPLKRHKPITIGRSEECDVVLADRQVSRVHARVSWNGEQYQLEDLGSKNGTHINGKPAQSPIPLQDGDEFQIGLRFRLAFIDAGATVPLSFSREENGLRLDKETRQLWIGGAPLDPPLSLPQYRLLEILWDADGSVVTRDEIIEAVWPEDSVDGISEQAIDALVRRLRERLADVDQDFRYIVTVRGHGFRLDNR